MTRKQAKARNPKRFCRIVAACGAAFIVGIVGLTGYDAVTSYRTVQDDAWRELDAQARVVAEQTARSLQAVDVVLRNLVAEHAAGMWLPLSQIELHKHLQEKTLGLIQADGVAYFNPDGTLHTVSSLDPALNTQFNASEDPGFIELKMSAEVRLFIHDVRFARNLGRWIFPISYPLKSKSGAFMGSVTALGRVDYFQHFYRDAFGPRGLRVSLLHQDASLLASYPADATQLKQKYPLDAAWAAQPTSGGFTSRTQSPIDGVDRLSAMRQVPEYPLRVVVSRDADVVFAQWQTLAHRLILRTLALASLAAFLLIMTLRQLARLDAIRVSLEQSQERYALAVLGSNEGLWDWDLSNDELFISERGQEVVFGVVGVSLQPRADWVAKAHVHPEDAVCVRKALSQHLRNLTPHFTVEFRVHHAADPADHWRWCRPRGIALRDARGRAYRMAGSMEDITPRKEAEAQHAQLEHQLRKAQKLEAIGTLAGGIAHDFNNILAAILGFGDLARKDAAAGSRQRSHIEAILASGLRAKSLVDRILSFSRIGVGEHRPVHVQSVVAEALDCVAATLPAGVQLARQLNAGHAGVKGDTTQLHQIVMNLCTNAIHASASSGVVTVTVEVVTASEPMVLSTTTLPPGRYVCVAVQDAGSGIPADLVDRIFDPFFTTKEVGVGTGLGLSLVHGIVVELGGGIEVKSHAGQGSVFRVYLATTGDATPLPLPATRATPALGEGETILIVDDELPLVELAEESLASLGYEPVPFSSSRLALEVFTQNPDRFDLVISDEAMPGMTGSDLARHIHALRPGMPIVMMSGAVTPALLERARAAGIKEVLSKPLGEDMLANCLARMFGRVPSVP